MGSAYASFGPVATTPAGFYAKPNPASGIANSYGFRSDITYVGGYSQSVYLELRDDLANPSGGYARNTFPYVLTASEVASFTLQSDPAKTTVGMHRLRVIAQTQDVQPGSSNPFPSNSDPIST